MLPLFFGLHILGTIAFFIGFLFLLVLAVKTLTHAQLKRWGLWLMLGGLAVGAVAMGLGWDLHDGFRGEHGMRRDEEKMMQEVDKEQAQGQGMDGQKNAMTMNDMVTSLQGKTGDAFDKAFIEGMIAHHQGAIDMARQALTSAGHAEIKRMAAAILSAQQREINQMRQWAKNWSYTQ